jgi:replicative DNA helicase
MALEVVASPSPPRDYLPRSLEAERFVLGAIMLKPSALREVAALLRVDDLFLPGHREIFDAMLDLDKRGDPYDIVAVADELRTRGALSKLEDGEMYLMKLDVGTGENVGYYARLVKEKSVLRQLISISKETAARAQGDVRPAELLSEYRARVDKLDAGGVQRGPERIGLLVEGALKTVQHKHDHQDTFVVKTGLSHFDEKFHGLISGFIIVAARPGMSKTSYVLTTMIRMAVTGTPGLMFSKEMGKQRLLERAVSFTSRVDGTRIIRGTVDHKDWELIDRGGARMLGEIPLYLDDRTDLSAEDMISEIKHWLAQRDAEEPDPTKRKKRVVAIDSMSLMRLQEEGKFRSDDVTKMSRMFKNFAAKHDIVLIMIVHLNREVSKGKKPRKPMLADLRESGALEQDADMVIFTHREPGQKGAATGPVDAQLIVEKNRDGATGEVSVSWDARYMAFYDLIDE